jgi:hypothetical protein
MRASSDWELFHCTERGGLEQSVASPATAAHVMASQMSPMCQRPPSDVSARISSRLRPGVHEALAMGVS